MSDIAIKVEGLSKLYKIGRLQKRHDTLRDRIADARLFNLFKRRNGNGHLTSDLRSPTSDSDLWALKDVSFEVKRGEVVGIIGRNGAGKSTLLKILSRITEPTTGAVDIYGRVGSLLEVGTGFHPELTGRENIYLNGSILGMKRVEINRKFDEIVAFAEIEKFIDTPVKHYSSGMYVRLAFAVAAHLDPEILLVDEVLAVGDAAFQKKCLGKMGDVAQEGRTILFVSHNMGAVSGLCKKSVLLQTGQIVNVGDTHSVISEYLSSMENEAGFSLSRIRILDPRFSITDVYLTDDAGLSTTSFNGMRGASIHVVGRVSTKVNCSLECVIKDSRRTPIIFHAQGHFRKQHYVLSPGGFHLIARIKQLRLASGKYSIDLSLTQTNMSGYVDMQDIVAFEVKLCDPYDVGFNFPSSWGRGALVLDIEYERE